MSVRSSIAGGTVSIAPGGNFTAVVQCPAGKIVTGGGGQTSAFHIFFTDSFQSGNGWAVRGANNNPIGGATESLTAVAVCIG